MRHHLFNTEKIKYVGSKKNHVDCILCAIRDHDDTVEVLEVYRTELFIVTVNLYPFNPGHLMIFPQRHIMNLEDMTEEEALHMHRLTVKTLHYLNEEFKPSGFNVGYNLGQWSGASISHIHQHIVPRFPNEIGFLDVLADTRVMVIDPNDVMKRMRNRFHGSGGE